MDAVVAGLVDALLTELAVAASATLNDGSVVLRADVALGGMDGDRLPLVMGLVARADVLDLPTRGRRQWGVIRR